MLHVTCDACGRQLRPTDEHHVIKIEVFATTDPHTLTDEDLDEDHLEAVADLLRQAEESDEPIELEPRSVQLRYDLCCSCRKRYLRDPLGRETAQKLHFSPN
jgi:hypothetical protein